MDSTNNKCFILTSEELAKLGVKIESLPGSSSRNDSTPDSKNLTSVITQSLKKSMTKDKDVKQKAIFKTKAKLLLTQGLQAPISQKNSHKPDSSSTPLKGKKNNEAESNCLSEECFTTLKGDTDSIKNPSVKGNESIQDDITPLKCKEKGVIKVLSNTEVSFSSDDLKNILPQCNKKVSKIKNFKQDQNEIISNRSSGFNNLPIIVQTECSNEVCELDVEKLKDTNPHVNNMKKKVTDNLKYNNNQTETTNRTELKSSNHTNTIKNNLSRLLQSGDDSLDKNTLKSLIMIPSSSESSTDIFEKLKSAQKNNRDSVDINLDNHDKSNTIIRDNVSPCNILDLSEDTLDQEQDNVSVLSTNSEDTSLIDYKDNSDRSSSTLPLPGNEVYSSPCKPLPKLPEAEKKTLEKKNTVAFVCRPQNPVKCYTSKKPPVKEKESLVIDCPTNVCNNTDLIDYRETSKESTVEVLPTIEVPIMPESSVPKFRYPVISNDKKNNTVLKIIVKHKIQTSVTEGLQADKKMGNTISNNENTKDLISEKCSPSSELDKPVKKRGRPTKKSISTNDNTDSNSLNKDARGSLDLNESAVRKRGRPRKKLINQDASLSDSFDQTLSKSDNNMSDSSKLVFLENIELGASQTSKANNDDQPEDNYGRGMKRRRGRPPKNDYIYYGSDSDDSDMNKPLKRLKMDESNNPSKRGRPRKTTNEPPKVDFGSETEDSTKNKKLNTDIVPENVTPAKRKRGRPRKSDTANSKEDSGRYNTEKNSSSSSSTSEDENSSGDSEYHPGKTNKKNASSPDDRKLDETAEDSSKDDSLNGKNKSSSYNWTGNRVKTVGQLFSFMQGKELDESSGSPMSATKRKGRPRTMFNENDEIEEGSTKCMVCHVTMDNSQWPKHRLKVHNNMAWKQGEPSLDLYNKDLAMKILISTVRKHGKLKCHRCKFRSKKSSEFYQHLEMCNGVLSSNGNVTCAVCKEELKKNLWQYHRYRKHNNLAWREGETPLNLEDRDLVMRILTDLYKARKPLHCEVCDQVKKSVLGFLSHKSTCQKTAEEIESVKVACHLCGSRVLPVSMEYHMKIHNRPAPNPDADYSGRTNVEIDTGKKRKAAKKALSVINNLKESTDDSSLCSPNCDFREEYVTDILNKINSCDSDMTCVFEGCDFKEKSVEEMVNHLSSCDRKPKQYYTCKLCLETNADEKEIEKHLKIVHSKTYKPDRDFIDENFSEEEDEETGDQTISKPNRQGQRICGGVVQPEFLNYGGFSIYRDVLFRPTYYWTMEFCNTNFNKSKLFDDLRNNRPLTLLDPEAIFDFMPGLEQSCGIAAEKIKFGEKIDSERRYVNLEQFEVAELYEGDKTIFCGGPVTALAWLPTPHDRSDSNQIVAVSVLNDVNRPYALDKYYSEPIAIQFWDFGVLDVKAQQVPTPSLLFCLALSIGPIWHLEWCPSGCYDCSEGRDYGRLGLLAVAAADSNVYIYAIDKPQEDKRGLVYKGEPVLRLQLSIDTSSQDVQAFYPTKISWTKAEGHRYVAVGYSSGLVAIFDLTHSILKQQTDALESIIFPYTTFQAHISVITALSLNHLNGGNRWLLTGSFDKHLTFWDLKTNTKISTMRKNSVSDALWPTQWLCALAGEEENATTHLNMNTIFKSPNDFFAEPGFMTTSCSAVHSVSFGDWLNAILHASKTGEVLAMFNHQILYRIDSKKRNRYHKFVFSTTKMLEKNSDSRGSEPDELNYSYATNKYNLVFTDYNLNDMNGPPSSHKKTINKLKLPTSDFTRYNLECINKVVFNPNHQSCSFYAAGYQAGFLRLHRIGFIDRVLAGVKQV